MPISFDSLLRGAKAFIDEIRMPESYVVGRKFENVVMRMFPEEDWILFKMTQGYQVNKERYEKNSEEPDFRFQHRNSKRFVNIECKYRSGLFDGKVKWCEYYQLKRYKRIDDKHHNVYIILGLRGKPNKPERIFRIPLADIKYNALFEGWLKNYEVPRGHKFGLEYGRLK